VLGELRTVLPKDPRIHLDYHLSAAHSVLPKSPANFIATRRHFMLVQLVSAEDRGGHLGLDDGGIQLSGLDGALSASPPG
jgi:hypothetical protein